MKKKNMLRMGTLIVIVIFLLLPLMSTPVAAAFSITARGDTDNTTTGPSASVTVPPGPYPIIFPDVGQRVGTFLLEYYFNDNNGGGTGSWHRATMDVSRNPGPNPGSTSTNWVFVPAGGSASGTLSIIDSYTAGTTYIWDVDIEIECYDNSLGQPGASAPGWYQVRVN